MTPSPLPTLRPLRVLLITLALALASTLGLSTAGATDVLTAGEDTGGAGGNTPGRATASYDDLLAGSGYETAAISPADGTTGGEVATTDTPIADSAVDETARAAALRDLTDGSTTTFAQSQHSQFEPKSADERALEQIGLDQAMATTDTPIADSAVDETARGVALQDLTDDTTTALTQNERSILMNESLYVEGGVLAGGEDDDLVLTQNQQSILLAESLYAPGGVQAGGAEPTAINGRGQLAHALTEHVQAQHAQATAELAPQAAGPQQTPY